MKQRDGQVVLAEPYAATKLTTAGPQAYKATPQEVAGALRRRRSRRSRAVRSGSRVQFVESKDELTEESKAALEAIFAEIAKRPVPDVLVVGHTDSVGSDQYNDALSRQRADVIRAGLIQNGIAPENIVAVGRGKRELLVPTADGVAEPRNRRVEIVVR